MSLDIYFLSHTVEAFLHGIVVGVVELYTVQLHPCLKHIVDARAFDVGLDIVIVQFEVEQVAQGFHKGVYALRRHVIELPRVFGRERWDGDGHGARRCRSGYEVRRRHVEVLSAAWIPQSRARGA